jgi:hypothetical protein
MASVEAWCAHTMTAANAGELVCCDCGRSFTDREHVERVQENEAETGFIHDETASTTTN